MNPFSYARNFGYSTGSILNFLQRNIPGMSSKVQQAKTLGYGEAAILNFIANQYPDAQVSDANKARYAGTELAIGRRGYTQPKNDDLSGVGAIMGGGLGGLAGYALGGPAGAVQGAAAGATSLSQLLSAYNAQAAKGGSLGLADFLRAAATGITSATLARSVMGMLNLLEPSQQNAGTSINVSGTVSKEPPLGLIESQSTVSSDNFPISPSGPNVPSGGSPSSPMPGGLPSAATPTISPIDAVALFTGMKGMGGTSLINTLKTLSKSMPPEDAAAALRTLVGKQPMQNLEAQTGMPLESLVSSAYQGLQSQKQNMPAEQKSFVPQEAGQEEPIPVSEPKQQIEPQRLQGEAEKRPVENIPLMFSPRIKQDDQNAEVVRKILNEGIPNGPIKAKKRKIESVESLPSSNIRSIFYDPKKQYMQTLFSNGQAYEFNDIPKKEVQNVIDGLGIAQTIGQTPFRVYHPGRGFSIGNAFDNYIKKAGHEGFKIDDDKMRDRMMRAVKKSDRVIKSIDTLDGFARIFENARAQQDINRPDLMQALEEVGANLSLEEQIALNYEIRLAMRKYDAYRKSKNMSPYNWTATRQKEATIRSFGKEPKRTPRKRKLKTESQE